MSCSASVTCRAGTGFTGSEATQQLGLAVDGSEIAGALADDALNEADLAAGRYDAAASRSIWSTGASRRSACCCARASSARCGARARRSPPSCARSRIGSPRRAGGSTPRPARADLGDARCRIDLDDPAFRGSGDVTALDGHLDRSSRRGSMIRGRLVHGRPADLDSPAPMTGSRSR